MFRAQRQPPPRNDLSVFDMSQDSEPPRRDTVFEESQENQVVGRTGASDRLRSGQRWGNSARAPVPEQTFHSSNAPTPNGGPLGASTPHTRPKPMKRNFDFDVSSSDDEDYGPDLRGSKARPRQKFNLTKRNSAGARIPWGEEDSEASPTKNKGGEKRSPNKQQKRQRTHAPSIHLQGDVSRENMSHQAASNPQVDRHGEKQGPKPVFLFSYKGMTGYCEVHAMQKKVGPIQPPRMLATILPADTDVQGLGSEVHGLGQGLIEQSTTAGRLLEDCGHAHNVLSYHVQELRNTLSLAGYRCWKPGAERLDCLYLPSHVDTKTDGVTMSYAIRGCNAKRATVFYARTGEVPLSIRNGGALNSAERLLANLQSEEPEDDAPKPRKRKARQQAVDADGEEGEASASAGRKGGGKGKQKGKAAGLAEGGEAAGQRAKRRGKQAVMASGSDQPAGGADGIVEQIRKLGDAQKALRASGHGRQACSPHAGAPPRSPVTAGRAGPDDAPGDDDWVTVCR